MNSIAWALLCAVVGAPMYGEVRLQADAATTKHVALSWTGSASRKCELARASGNTWTTIATTADSKADDSKIEPYATYRYRVTCAPEKSGEITVGPPPAGFHLIAPRPDKHPDGTFGRLISVALDSNGDPAAAFVYADPNGDGNYADSEIQFVAWDRAAYRWRAPVSVGVVGNYDPRPPVAGVSLAHDASTDAFGIVWTDTDNHGLNLAISMDSGKTWKVEKALTDTRSIGGATLGLAGGKVHIALTQDSHNSIRYMTGALDAGPGTWKASYAPLLSGSPGVLKASSLALDADGAPALAYWLRPSSGSVWTLAYWRPGNEQATKVTDSGDSGYAPDGVLLAFSGRQPGIVLDSRLHRAQASSHYSTVSKDNGATWSAPAVIPDDGNEHMGGYMSFAMAAEGHAAFAGDVAGGNTTGMRCGWPKLARSSDMISWTTCAPQGEAKTDTRTLWGTVVFAPSRMLYLVFLNRQIAPGQPLPAGLMIWGGE